LIYLRIPYSSAFVSICQYLVYNTTTTQLNSALEGESVLSAKAIIALIEQFKINPTFLFLGQGEMFQSDESEIALKDTSLP
jgi:hypothetical protein